MPVFVCNHCGLSVKNNGGSCREIGMIEVGIFLKKFYCFDCAKEICLELLGEI